jgi:cytochrome c-type biogenesis protein CcmH
VTSRRSFLARLAAGSAVAALVPPRMALQQTGAPPSGRPPMQMHDSASGVRDSTNLFAMDQSAARTVVRPPKPGAAPSMTDDARDDLEHHIRCQCGCTLDVYTCRTTDFSCQVSPSMHRDVIALVKGGYSAQEIIDAFVDSYGQRVLMAPRKSGFNLLAWFTPGIAVIVGGVVVFMLLRRWGGPRDGTSSGGRATQPPPAFDATSEELARLDAAIKGDDS